MRIKPVCKMFFIEMRFSFFVFWSILAAVFVIGNAPLIISDQETVHNIGGIISIYVFFIVIGLTMLKNSFPFSLGMSATRKEYFVGAVLTWITMAFVSSLLQLLFYFVENKILLQMFGAVFHYFTPLGSMSVGMVLWSGFILPLVLGSGSFFISSVQYRFGLIGVLMLFAAMLLTGVLLSVLKLWETIFSFLINWLPSFAVFTVWLIPVMIIFFVLGWLCMRKAPVKAAS